MTSRWWRQYYPDYSKSTDDDGLFHRKISPILEEDDMVLMEDGVKKPQKAVDVLERVLSRRSMEVNVGKILLIVALMTYIATEKIQLEKREKESIMNRNGNRGSGGTFPEDKKDPELSFHVGSLYVGIGNIMNLQLRSRTDGDGESSSPPASIVRRVVLDAASMRQEDMEVMSAYQLKPHRLATREIHLEDLNSSWKIPKKGHCFKSLPAEVIKLRGEVGMNIPLDLEKPNFCRDSLHCLSWKGNKVKLLIKRTNSRCHVIKWISTIRDPLVDCFSFGADNWFGGPEHWNQYWPIEELDVADQPYLPKENHFMAVTERYWLSSRGVYIHIDDNVPLFVDANNYRENSICFIAKDTLPYLPRDNTRLKYTICQFDNPREAHEHAIGRILSRPVAIPDTRMVQHPVWSTWVKFQQVVNESAVLEYAKNITRHGFNHSHIEIDDNWESCYGCKQFNLTRFPNPKQMVGKLSEMGFRVTLWTHPFVNLDCHCYVDIAKQGHLVEGHRGHVTTRWWNGEASVIDVTKENTAEWFKMEHVKLMNEIGVEGFKFDAGETSWLPQASMLNGTYIEQPAIYVKSFVDVASAFGGTTEVRVGFRTQMYPVFVRMLDKDSRWSFENGLPTLITTLLLFNMVGYPWVLPDMVGGNGYDGPISKELFIRWLQATTFMPSIQFSAAPFDYDNETIEICKNFTSLHYKYSAKIIDLMKNIVEVGGPLNPPVWWVDPTNPSAHWVNSEYMLGEDILVAPVLKQGARTRDIYLPKGLWRDENHPNRYYTGRNWLRNYPADLRTLPYFSKVSVPAGYDSSKLEPDQDEETSF